MRIPADEEVKESKIGKMLRASFMDGPRFLIPVLQLNAHHLAGLDILMTSV